MNTRQQQQHHNPETDEVKRGLRWDLVGLVLASVIAVFFIFILDTDSLAEWVARHRESKIDEVIVVGIVLLIGVSFSFLRRWLGLSHQLIKYEESQPIDHISVSVADQVMKSQRRDLIGLFLALLAAAVVRIPIRYRFAC